jgi:catecholate siderophore receptor
MSFGDKGVTIQMCRHFKKSAVTAMLTLATISSGTVPSLANATGESSDEGLATGMADGAPRSGEIVVTGRSTDYVVPEVSAIRIDAEPRDIPQTVDVVSEQVLRDQRALSLGAALRNVAGIGFATGDGQRDQFTIRGFDAQGDMFVDGVRDDSLYFRDLSNVERIEVIKGPASVLYGRGSSGGLINRVTKKPGTDGGEIALTYGSWDNRRAEMDIGQVLEGAKVAFRVTGAIERSDSYRDQQFIDRDAIAPSMSIALGDHTTLLVQADYLRDRRIADNGIPSFQGLPVDVPQSAYYGAANAREADFAQAEVWSTTATLEHRFNDVFSLRNVARYYDYTLDRQDTFVASADPRAQTATLSHGNTDRQEDGWFNQFELTADFSIGALEHTLLAGVEVSHQNKYERRINTGAGTVDLFDPVLPVIERDIAGTPRVLRRNYYDVVGLYVQDLVSLGEHWKLLAGLRFDRFRQKSRQLDSRNTLSRTDNDFSPRAGLVWQPNEAQSYYVSWSRSFQPSAETYGLAATSADIAPETTENLEAGAKYNLFDGRLETTVSIFNLRRSNIKAVDPVTLQTVPVGVQRTRGIELSGRMNLFDGWSAVASYAYMDAEIVKSPAVSGGIPLEGKRPALAPKKSGNLWVTRNFGERFTLGGGISYIGDRMADPANTVRLPGYVTADAMASLKLDRLELQVNVNNIFDRDYIVSAHGTSPNLLMPGAPRSAMVTMRYAFD